MKSGKVIEKQIARLARERDKIDADAFKKRIPRLMKMVGKTFVYRRNSYSCPNNPSDYWDVFRKLLMVIHNDGGATLIFKEVQINCQGRATVSNDSHYIHGGGVWPASGWEACPREEFDGAAQLTLEQIEQPELYRAYWESK